MTQTIRWGIIGCGGIARKFARSAEAVEGVEVVAAASRTPGKAKAFAGEFGIATHYSDYASLLVNEQIDAVYVATTHNFHYESVKQVLEAGKPALCEKPLTVNSTEMKSLKALAAARNLFLMEAMWTRYLPAIVYLRELLAEKVIGEIKQIRATFGFQMTYDPQHRMYNPELAGGALLDAGIYPISFANMVMKEMPQEIKALAEISPTGVDAQSSYIFRYRNGALAMLNSTSNAPVVSRAEIIGSGGRITLPEKFLGATVIQVEQNGKDPVTTNFDFDEDTGFRFEIEAASESIRNGDLENSIMPLDDTVQIMEIIDEIKSQLNLVYGNDT